MLSSTGSNDYIPIHTVHNILYGHHCSNRLGNNTGNKWYFDYSSTTQGYNRGY